MVQARVNKLADADVAETIDVVVRNKTIHLEGINEEVEVNVCKLKDIPAFLGFVMELYTDLDIDLGDKSKIEETVAQKLNDGAFILKLISSQWRNVMQMLGTLTNLSTEKIENLDPGDAMLLIKEVGLVNYDFFIKRVLPLLPGLLAEKLGAEK